MLNIDELYIHDQIKDILKNTIKTGDFNYEKGQLRYDDVIYYNLSKIKINKENDNKDYKIKPVLHGLGSVMNITGLKIETDNFDQLIAFTKSEKELYKYAIRLITGHALELKN